MAAKPPKPPDSNHSSARAIKSNSEQTSQQDSRQCQSNQDERSDCSCTNISIRQLFYEMKQIFPTVPDNVVNQCVIENCHDRENCMKVLNNELAAHPTPAQSYPSKAIRGVNVGSGGVGGGSGGQVTPSPITPSKRPLVPARPAPAPKAIMNSSDFQSLPKALKTTVNHIKQGIGNKLASVIASGCNNSSNSNSIGESRVSAVNSGSPVANNETLRKPNVPQRPTTLNLRDPATANAPNNTRTLSRPTRTAPLPPTTPATKNLPPPPPPSLQLQSTLSPPPPAPQFYSQQNVSSDSVNQSFSSGPSIQSPMSFSDSGESEISVNISLSPSSSDRSRGGMGGSGAAPTRCITTISVQPEPAYTKAMAGGDSGMSTSSTPTPQRSYTSLNLTLRKPSDSPQSPIDITAGSVLKYSSTRYDAINGCEQNFHITVTDGGGSITSSRIRPRSCHYDPDTGGTVPEQQCVLRTGISMPNVASQNSGSGDMSLGVGVGSATTAAQDEIIRRQQARKSKLLNEVKNKRQQLEEMNKEINILQSPISPNVCDRLDREIEILRCDCERLCNEINFRNGNAGVSFERVFENIYNGQQAIPSQQQRPPPIPPALSRFRSRPSPTDHQPSTIESSLNAPAPNPYQRSQSYPVQAGAIPNHSGYDQADYTNANYIDDNGPPWTCSMCTFQNYPLLNKCEGCDNVRIIPGTVQIVPSSSAPQINSLLASASSPNNNAPSPNPATSATNYFRSPQWPAQLAFPPPPVATPHNAPLPSRTVVNNNINQPTINLSFPYRPTNIGTSSPSIPGNNNSGPAPNMHQLIAYPAVMNPNFFNSSIR